MDKKITCTGGHNQWYTVSLDIREAPGLSTWQLDFSSNGTKLMPFQDAADYAAQLIAGKHSNIFVGLSGGLDSEYIAEVLYRNSIPFTPIILERPDSRDHEYALYWCKQHNIIPMVIKFDVNQLLRRTIKIVQHLKQRILNYVIIYYLADIAEEHGGVLITGEPTIGDDSIAEFGVPIGDTFGISIGSFMTEIFHGSRHPGPFFLYTPELMYSYAMHLDTTISDAESRSKLYNLPFRPKNEPVIYSTETVDKLVYLLKQTKYTSLPDNFHVVWNKQDFISKFQ